MAGACGVVRRADLGCPKVHLSTPVGISIGGGTVAERSWHRIFQLVAVLVLPVSVGLLLYGCGGGGGAPAPAGTGCIEGTVVDAVTGDSIADAYVYVPLVRQADGGRQTGPPPDALVWTQTDQNGHFVLRNTPTGNVPLKILPPPDSPYGALEIRLTVPEDTTVEQDGALLSSDVAANLQGLSIEPVSAALQVGDSQTFTATAVGRDLPSLIPTWFVQGGIGMVSSDGAFTATAVGEGTVNAALGDKIASATVVVTEPETAGNEPPTATLAADPVFGVGPLEVTFECTGSDSDGQIVRWVLTFGDGTPPISSQDALPQSRTHTYTTPNTCTASLTVIDDGNGVATATQDITVIASGGSGITGVVTDKITGETLAGALVALFDSDNQFVAETTTGENGVYAFGSMEVGTYSLVVVCHGYEQLTVPNVVVQPDQSARCDVQLDNS